MQRKRYSFVIGWLTFIPDVAFFGHGLHEDHVAEGGTLQNDSLAWKETTLFFMLVKEPRNISSSAILVWQDRWQNLSLAILFVDRLLVTLLHKFFYCVGKKKKVVWAKENSILIWRLKQSDSRCNDQFGGKEAGKQHRHSLYQFRLFN